MIYGIEFHPILERIFGDVRNIHNSEQLQVNCPKCEEREGLLYPDGKYNLEVNTRIRKFHCWKCEGPPFKGSLGRLVRMLGNNKDYAEYKEFAGTFFDYDGSVDEKVFEIVRLPQEFIPFKGIDTSNEEHMEAYMYMTLERQIPKEIIEKYRLGFCLTGIHKNRIIMPSYDDDGELNYYMSRTYMDNVKPSYLNPEANRDIIIFNEGLINWDSTVFLVEGGFEFLSFPVNTVPLLGKKISQAMFFKLKKHKPNVVIVLDPDAYYDAILIYDQLKAIYVGEEYKVKILKLNKGRLDLDEIKRKYGKDEVVRQLYRARELQDIDYIKIR